MKPARTLVTICAVLVLAGVARAEAPATFAAAQAQAEAADKLLLLDFYTDT